MTREEIAKMELEMETIERDLKTVESSYGENMLNLTVARGYIKRLLENAKVVKFLAGNYRDWRVKRSWVADWRQGVSFSLASAALRASPIH